MKKYNRPLYFDSISLFCLFVSHNTWQSTSFAEVSCNQSKYRPFWKFRWCHFVSTARTRDVSSSVYLLPWCKRAVITQVSTSMGQLPFPDLAIICDLWWREEQRSSKPIYTYSCYVAYSSEADVHAYEVGVVNQPLTHTWHLNP